MYVNEFREEEGVNVEKEGGRGDCVCICVCVLRKENLRFAIFQCLLKEDEIKSAYKLTRNLHRSTGRKWKFVK